MDIRKSTHFSIEKEVGKLNKSKSFSTIKTHVKTSVSINGNQSISLRYQASLNQAIRRRDGEIDGESEAQEMGGGRCEVMEKLTRT